MPFEIKMPALSPTMEEGTLAKWLVAAGDMVKPGDILAEIETDKATIEFETIDEGRIASLMVSEGSDGVQVGTVIALLEAAEAAQESTPAPAPVEPVEPVATRSSPPSEQPAPVAVPDVPELIEVASGKGKQPDASRSRSDANGSRASPLARRIAAGKGVDLSAVRGSGPNGRIVKADVEPHKGPHADRPPSRGPIPIATLPPASISIPDVPHELGKLSNMRKAIARRLTESKQQVPHIYLTVDVRLDALLALRAELNAGLASRGLKLSINDFMVKALAAALVQVPKCNVMFTPDQLVSFARADISVAVSMPEGLITPVITHADTASLSSISTRMKDLAARARDKKLKPEEFAGGTASLSNLGMYGIKQFEAVINPPQAMIMAVGGSERRPWVLEGDELVIAQVMSATGSFDHRAIDGADGAALMQAFKTLVEAPFGLL